MINIILSPSQQTNNKCVMGDSEEDHCFKIAKLTADLLKEYDCNVCLIPKQLKDLKEVVAMSNHFVKTNPAKLSFHLDIHTDGGYNGNGSSGFFASENGRQFITIIHQEISKITPWADASVNERGSLYVLSQTTAIAGLIELSFHDRLNEAKFIHENMGLFAVALVEGLIRACGLVKRKADEAFINCVNVLVKEGIIKEPEKWYNIKDANIIALIKNTANRLFELTGV